MTACANRNPGLSSGAVVTVIALVTAAWLGIGDASFAETFLFL